MRVLYVLYDPRCGLCTEAKDWLASQPAHVQIQVLASDCEEARRLFAALPAGELAAVSDSGEVWLGDNVFLVCLWALRGYRSWAYRLAGPSLRPLARRAFTLVSENRAGISNLLGLQSEMELKRRLAEVTIPPCRKS